MDDAELYDEFGNYIGPELSDSESESAGKSDDDDDDDDYGDLNPDANEIDGPENRTSSQNGALALTGPHGEDGMVIDDNQDERPGSRAIILAEDKEYYPSAAEVFGPETEVLVEEEDTEPFSKPIIEPKIERSSALFEEEDEEPVAKYSREYLAAAILRTPALVRNIALIGALHHGKTSFADRLFESSHEMYWDNLPERRFPIRYTDTRKDEQQLKISLKTTPATFLLPDLAGKSFGLTVLDTPGHVNFIDESIAALSLVDGVVVFVDVAEGVILGTEMLLKKAAALRLDIVLVVSKIDRLIVELRLPPQDAYHKIRDVVDSVNEILSVYSVNPLSPGKGNVAFSASTERICFTLPQFAMEYIEAHGGVKNFPLSKESLAKCFWGDVYYNSETRKFIKGKPSSAKKRSFVEFVLEPLYKLHSAVVGEDVNELAEFLARNNLLEEGRKKEAYEYRGRVPKAVLKADVKKLLRIINGESYGMGSVAGFVNMVVRHISSPEEAATRKLDVMKVVRNYADIAEHSAGSFTENEQVYGRWFDAMECCRTERDIPFTAYVGKLIPDKKAEHFDVLARVMSGEIRTGDDIRVLGNSYHVDLNNEDQSSAEATQIFLPCARFNIPVTSAVAGQVVLIRGIGSNIIKSATITSDVHPDCRLAHIFRPLSELLAPGVVKVAIEPLRPSELPKMTTGIRKCVKAFPSLQKRVEESGEHILVGSGELYMDCVLRDLREIYGNLEIKVSDPVVPFTETVTETSALKCYADTPNEQNRITMIAEPLEDDFVQALEQGRFEFADTTQGQLNLSKSLRNFGWDALAAKSVWSFGPNTSRGPNVLVNDILDPDERSSADAIRDSIVQGFAWATREGPLTDEPVRGVKFSAVNANVSSSTLGRSRAQVIPAARRVAYSAFLTASPRLSEPVYIVEVICAPETVDVAVTLATRRRGNVISEKPMPGTPLVRMLLHLPVLDSFGFEPDLRHLTQGAAFCSQTFDHWSIVPGDPLDKSVQLRPLEPAGRRELARECMVKTRRRKGMPDDVSITKYFDDPVLIELASQELQQLL